MNPEARRAERAAPLAAMDAALTDPVRLVALLADAEDEADAARRLQTALGIPAEQAVAVLDLQFRTLTRARRARIAEELAVVTAEWGPALPATLTFTGGRSAVLTVAEAEHRFAGSRQSVLEQVTSFLLEHMAAPRLRPVVVQVSGAPRGPVRIEVLPSSAVSFTYADDLDG